MKRKRGHKKGKTKAASSLATASPANPVIATLVSGNTNDDDSNMDNNNENESGMEVDKVDTPSSTGTDQPLDVAGIKPDGSIDKSVMKSYSRVRVRLKTSKMLESDVPSPSDHTDKSGSQVGSERQAGGVGEKIEDCANSLAELKKGDSGNAGTKAGSIKIKSSSSSLRVLGGLSVDKSSNAGLAEGGGSTQQKEPKILRQEYRYSKQELDAALTVIKKVMKMDAAEPFNVPVNPEALGIPDYFDIIDTPMDFGTICSNLESGDKYMNSEDVFNDVQYIWDNCYKYNNKGDYILDLMRRVKKNFMKYWTAAGLYSDQPKGAHGVENIQVDESSQGKVHMKGGQLKHKKRHGRRHKSDCLCAICVLKRRKREREEKARMARGLDNYLAQDSKQEGSSPTGSPGGDDSSSNTDESLDGDEDAEVQGKGEEMTVDGSEQHYSPMEVNHETEEEGKDEEENETKVQKKGDSETKEQSQMGDRSGQEPNGKPQSGMLEKLGAVTNSQRPEEEIESAQQQKQKDSQERLQRAKLYESFQFQNPNLLSLCGILFPGNQKSVWSGPHSLVKQEGPSRTSSIHKAVEKILS